MSSNLIPTSVACCKVSLKLITEAKKYYPKSEDDVKIIKMAAGLIKRFMSIEDVGSVFHYPRHQVLGYYIHPINIEATR